MREEIARFLDKARPIERVMNVGLAALRRQVARPLLEREVQDIRASLDKPTGKQPRWPTIWRR